jgi:hypothetical protein
MRSLFLPWMFAVLSCLFAAAPGAAKPKWNDVDKALLAETQGVVDSEAPSETIFWEVHVTDTYEGDKVRSEIFHYRRVKVFNERGRDLESQVEIPYEQGQRVEVLGGRTIRSNGSIVELTSDAIFDRTTMKSAGLKGKAKSFAMPGVEPGSVIEYQWRNVRHSNYLWSVLIPAQRATPIRSMVMVFTPLTLQSWPYNMRIRAFNTTYPEPERGKKSLTIRLQAIPGLEEEPNMPPKDQIRPWFFSEYTDSKEPPLDQFWKKSGKEELGEWKASLEVTPAVRRLADSLTSGQTDPAERVRSLHEFCRTRIRNVYDDAYDFTDDQRNKLLEDRKRLPEETLRRGYGTDDDIIALLTALAQAAGFQSRVAITADRSEIFFQPRNRLPFQLSEAIAAVQVNGEWKFYDPANRNVPAGMLPWWEESQEALILDPDKPQFVPTQLSLPSRSLARRTGRLRLKEDGTLEGDVSQTFTGHQAARWRESLDHQSPEARLEAMRKDLLERWASAQIESLTLSGIDDPSQPFGIACRVSIPGYADRAGKRLLLQPEIFVRGKAPTFTSSTRTHWISFDYPWAEEDSITIELPAGYQIQADPAPGPLAIGKTIAHRMAVDVDEHVISMHRYFALGMDGTIVIDPSEYGRVKKAFDAVHQRDGFTVTLLPVTGDTGR